MACEMYELAKTPLGQAIQLGDLSSTQDLCKRRANVTFKDKKGNTFLHYVCTMYRPYIFNILAARGIDVNAQNKRGNTALHVTALGRECCHVIDLFMYGIDPTIRNVDGQTALDIATEQQQRYWLSAYQAQQPGMRKAVLCNDVTKVDYLLNCWFPCHIKMGGKDLRHLVANMKLHEIQDLVSRHWYSSLAIFGVLENDLDMLQSALTHETGVCNVNLLQKISRRHPHHVLQHAIRLNNLDMVQLLCGSGADVNTFVLVKEYFLGPLYFEVINFGKNSPNSAIMNTVLESGADFCTQDEHGRSILHYCIDKSNGTVPISFFKMLLLQGADVSLRDKSGCSARDVARLARRADLVDLIDAHLVQTVRDNNIQELVRLAENGYRDFFPIYLGKDMFIIASGNESGEAFQFFEELSSYQDTGEKIHSAIARCEPATSVIRMITSYSSQVFSAESLLRFKDRGFRNIAQKAKLYRNEDLVEWITQRYPHVTNQLAAPQAELTSFPLVSVLQCLEVYEKLVEEIKSTSSKSTKKFFRMLSTLSCSLSSLPFMFHQGGHQLVYNYEDLLMTAILNNKDDVAMHLVSQGVDCSVRKQFLLCRVIVWLNAEELCNCLDKQNVSEEIKTSGKQLNYWGLGVKQFVKMYQDLTPINLNNIS